MTIIFGDGEHPRGFSGVKIWLFFEVCSHYLEPKIHIPKNAGSQTNTWVMFVWPPWEDPGGGRQHLDHDSHQQVHQEHVEINIWHRKNVVRIAPGSTVSFTGGVRVDLQKGHQGRPLQDLPELISSLFLISYFWCLDALLFPSYNINMSKPK